MKKAILSIGAVAVMVLSCLTVVCTSSEHQVDGASDDDVSRWGLVESIDNIDEIIESLWYSIPGFKMTSLDEVVNTLKAASIALGYDPEDVVLEATCDGYNTVVGEEIKTSRIVTVSSMSVFFELNASLPVALLSSFTGGHLSGDSDDLLILDLEVEVSRITDCYMYFNELGNLMDEDYYSQTYIHIKGSTNLQMVDGAPVFDQVAKTPLDFFTIFVTDSKIFYEGDGFKMFPQNDEDSWDVEVHSIQDTEYSIHVDCNDSIRGVLDYIFDAFGIKNLGDSPINPDTLSGFITKDRIVGDSKYHADVHREDGKVKNVFFNDLNYRQGVVPFYDPFSWIAVPAKPYIFNMTYIPNAVHPLSAEEYQSHLDKMALSESELDWHTKDLQLDIHFMSDDSDSFDDQPLKTVTVGYDDPIDLSFDYDAGDGKKVVYWRVMGTDQYASPSDRVHSDLYLVAVLAHVVNDKPVYSDFRDSSESIIYWSHDIDEDDTYILWDDLGNNPDKALVVDAFSEGKPVYRWYIRYDGQSYLSGMFQTGISFWDAPDRVKWALDGNNILYMNLDYQGELPDGVKLRVYLDDLSDGEKVLLYSDDGKNVEFLNYLRVNNGVTEFYTDEAHSFALLLPDLHEPEKVKADSTPVIVMGVACILLFAIVATFFIRRSS